MSIRLEDLTWLEAEKALAEARVVLLPLGARLKEHGPHLPLNNDWILAERLADRVCEKVDVIRAPTLQFGYYPAFVEYPGSVHIGQETFSRYIEDVCGSLYESAQNPDLSFYILNTGVSTVRSLEPAQEALLQRKIHMQYTDWLSALEPLGETLLEQTRGSHADEAETSMMLELEPSCVRMELAQRDMEERKGPGRLYRNSDTQRGVYSRTGVWGDPTLATPEKGAQLVQHVVNTIVESIQTLMKQKP